MVVMVVDSGSNGGQHVRVVMVGVRMMGMVQMVVRVYGTGEIVRHVCLEVYVGKRIN